MGAKIAAFYIEAESIAGLDGKIQLAMLTRIPSTRALVEPDSPQNLARFESAIQTIRRSVTPPAPSGTGISLFPSLTPKFSIEVSGTHRALPQGEELLWGVLNSLHDAMVAVYERSGQCLLAWESKALEKRYPVSGEEPLVTLVTRLIGRELAAEIAQTHDGSFSQTRELEAHLGTHAIWLRVTLSSVHDEKGRTLGVNAFIQDMSEEKRHEARLRESEARLREHNRVFVELLSQKASFLSDLDATIRRVTEAAASTLGFGRVSVWFYRSENSEIACADLFELSSREHSSGLVLRAQDYPAYFHALAEQKTIAAENAHQDPRTSCFSAGYLTPLGIAAMLDVPIWAHGELVGVVCHEHLGGPRKFTADEESFAYWMANFVALAKELAR